MSEHVQNNTETHIGDISNHSQALGEQVFHNVPPNLSGMPPIPLELTNNIGNPNYWHTLVSELMK